MRKVYIGIPVHTGQVFVSTVSSLIESIKKCSQWGWELPTVYFRVGDTDLCRCRNAIIGRFMASDADDLVLIDSDISWNGDDLRRLVEHDVDFVAGAYKGRTDIKEMYFIQWPEKKEMQVDPATGFPLLKVNAISIGFARLRRSCVQKLVDSVGEPYRDPVLPDESYPWIIDFETRNGVRYEEGYSLCMRWRDLGGDVWVDPVINLGHMGPKLFESNLMGFLDKARTTMLADELNEVNKPNGNGADAGYVVSLKEGFPPQLMR